MSSDAEPRDAAAHCVAPGDADGDGHLGIYVACADTMTNVADRLLINDRALGIPAFVAATMSSAPTTRVVEV